MASAPTETLRQLRDKLGASRDAIADTGTMPPLIRKFFIYATAQGLLLQPTNSRSQAPPSNLLVDYASHTITPSLTSHNDQTSQGLESHGLLGLLTLASTAYLLSISRREQVAQIRGRPVYVITDVAFIPISSRSEAQGAIDGANRSLSHTGKRPAKSSAKGSGADTDEDTDGEEGSVAGTDDEGASLPDTETKDPPEPQSQASTVAADVIRERGRYGRFAERWFSKAGWNAGGRERQGMSAGLEGDLNREQRRQGLNALPDEAAEEDDATAKTDAVDQKKREEGEAEGLTDKVADAVEETVAEGIVKTLTPRILRTMRIWLSSRSFYFSYDHDLSRRLAMQEPSNSTLPLFKRFDPLYFWNRHLLEPVIEAGQYSFALPVLQGFVGQRAFTVGKTPKGEDDKIIDSVEDAGEVIELWERAIPRPLSAASETPQPPPDKAPETKDDGSKDFLITLVSRRSTKRAGLRYLRRGVDDGGNVANNVETEQLLSSPTWDNESKVFSLTQVRGSIPLFFSQSPYSFKPIPITYGSEATTHDAFNKHFRNILNNYGKVQIASLIDKHGTEKPIGELYQHHVDMTNEGQLPSHGFPTSADITSKPSTQSSKPLAFAWFDFHHECRAMNFQNVSYLLDVLTPSLTSFSWTETVSSRILKTQSGVVRTNCMDCLDRTNVVQSAIAGQILQSQLSTEYNLTIDLSSDPKTQWFNTLWADNGDAISKQYAGTAALKGDFTRTRKRNWTGAINDFSLTLGRYYNNIFGDYFLQTTIDFVLGNGDEAMWEEFESDLMTGDYALDMGRVRQGAVERCVKVVLGRSADTDPDQTAAESGLRAADDEDLISGYTLHTPGQTNTLKAQPFEECVLLLTNRALYAVRFDWNTEKVGSYERVELGDVVGLRRGTYVTSTLGSRNLDETRNVGFVVSYREGRRGIRRVNTRSLSTEVSKASLKGEVAAKEGEEEQKKGMEQKDFASETPEEVEGITKEHGKDVKDEGAEIRLLAFKALAPRHTATAADTTSIRSNRSGKGKKKNSGNIQDMSEKEVVQMITDEIHRLVGKATEGEDAERIGLKKKATIKLTGSVQTLKETADKVADTAREAVATDTLRPDSSNKSTSPRAEEAEMSHVGSSDTGDDNKAGKQMWEIEDEPIISVAEAKRGTGYLESIGYSLRRLVWS
ncbi:Inositol-1,4,5-trisphosphate 5-phosphatase 1 [Sphaceloma murrayae]|uniref:Inositol-1,4,5-trisphosphate 5-phosphatase 1 n=1 Tax=Sphaceloma murrayae TaxID=2082308 RepID=A0A2K1QQA9_9PEZI|nr:Inositol-1,4,5-trisphosphate 5-phosphatase 1 [Sphaceloma murrayae]